VQLVYLGAAWLGGIAVASYFTIPPGLLVLVAFLIPVPPLLWSRNRAVLIGMTSVLVALLAIVRYQHATSHLVSLPLSQFNDAETARQLSGSIASDPVTHDTSVSFQLAVREVSTAGQPEMIGGIALVYIGPGEHLRYGDTVTVTGKLQAPANFSDFDYQGYLARQGISSVVYNARVESVTKGGGVSPLGVIYELRRSFVASLQNSLPTPEAELAEGILLGGSSTMPSDLKEDFRRAGLLHIVAISGYNMSIIAGLALQLGTHVFGRRRATILGGASIALFAVFWGPQPSVLRAAIMAGLALLAMRIGRVNFAPNALALSAIVLTAFDPLVLWDVSFQLSFAATAGVLFLTPLLVNLLDQVWRRVNSAGQRMTNPVLASVIESLALTLGATFATLPIVSLDFHTVSLVAPLANLVVLPVIPSAMLLAALQSMLGLLFPLAAQILSPPTWAVLHYVVRLSQAFASLPTSSVNVSAYDTTLAALSYGLLTGLAWLGQGALRSSSAKPQASPTSLPFTSLAIPWLPSRWLLLIGAILIVAVPWQQFSARRGLDRLAFLDVGQGDAILIQTSGGYSVLIDGGPSAQRLFRQLDAQLPFWQRSLSLVIATHPHEDHLAGLTAALERYNVGQVLDSGLPCRSSTCSAWHDEIRKTGVSYTVARAGQVISLGKNSRLEVLRTGTEATSAVAEEEAPSVMLRFVSGQVAVLLTGDEEATGQRELLAMGVPIASQILKVPHHGSKGALEPAFLNAVQPTIALISVGTPNHFGHPAPETLDLLADRLVLRTDQSGSIIVNTDGKEYWMATSR